MSQSTPATTTLNGGGADRPSVDEALRAALDAGPRPPRPGAVAASLTFCRRALLKVRHDPQQLFDAIAFPVMVTLVFTFLFGGAIAGSTHDYVQFLLPGIVVLTVVMISMSTGVALNTDISKGVNDRFRSMSIWRPSVLVGELLSDTVRYLMASTVAVLLGLALGFRPHGGFVGVVAALALIQVFAFSLAWVWTALGLVVHQPQTIMTLSGLGVFPLLFCSNIFVSTRSMPGWLQAVVNVNPVTRTVTAVRGLMSGSVTATQIGTAFLAYAVLIVVFGSLTVRLYNKER
ncbi:ABC transporter permease [Spirillospora sp. NBC_01491]|uniref:ABC transporter permease n=1 Tax=Spirillospora sp. NBC_01491 TaxID=2976007 RepID=UPI002E303AAE|nr:ABC transporter permease [Spirillospora sp. NBC_01491]